MRFQRMMSTAVSSLPKTCVIGAAGGIGQPLSLLLKTSPSVGDLNLYDVSPATPGIAADISHICTKGKVTGYTGKEQLNLSLEGVKAVVIPAGVPRKPGMTRDDLFNTNAGIVSDIAKACAEVCPDAFFFIISNPVNSTVPIFSETFKKVNKSKFNSGKIFGVTTLDVTRANTFCAEILKKKPEDLNVTVIGGHAGTTILPLLSGIKDYSKFTETNIKELTKRIQFGGDEVVAAKAGAGSATLSMAYAAQVFVEQVLSVVTGKVDTVTACTFAEHSKYSSKFNCDFFAAPTKIGKSGIVDVLDVKLNAFEQKVFDEMIPDLRSQVKKGREFVLNKK